MMKVWIIEYRVRAGWRPIFTLAGLTKREAKYHLRGRQALEPDEEFRIAKYVREKER